MQNENQLHEACGVFGIYRQGGRQGVIPEAYHALYALQHRGQESCGVAINTNGVITCHKDVGLVTDVFTHPVLSQLPEGSAAVAHCLYAPKSSHNRDNAQPMLVNHRKGALALCNNGVLTNAASLREELETNGAIFHTTSDAEIIAYLVAQERLRCHSIEQAVANAMDRMRGSFSMVIMSPAKLVAARDPHGFHPLCMGRIDDDIVFASESCALDAIGAEFVRDIEPAPFLAECAFPAPYRAWRSSLAGAARLEQSVLRVLECGCRRLRRCSHCRHEHCQPHHDDDRQRDHRLWSRLSAHLRLQLRR